MISMSAAELVQVRDALRMRLVELDRIKTTCRHCEHFARAPVCERFGEAPPQEFQATEGACPEWRFDGVPF